MISVLESFVSVVEIKAEIHICSLFPFHTAVIHVTDLQRVLNSGLIATEITIVRVSQLNPILIIVSGFPVIKLGTCSK